MIGNDATIAWAGASGSFELNVAIPVMGTALLESIRLLANASTPARRQDRRRPRGQPRARPRRSPSRRRRSSRPLNKLIGYEAAAKIAKHSVAKAITVREAVVDLGFVERGEVTEEQLDTALDVLSMTHPG